MDCLILSFNYRSVHWTFKQQLSFKRLNAWIPTANWSHKSCTIMPSLHTWSNHRTACSKAANQTLCLDCDVKTEYLIGIQLVLVLSTGQPIPPGCGIGRTAFLHQSWFERLIHCTGNDVVQTAMWTNDWRNSTWHKPDSCWSAETKLHKSFKYNCSSWLRDDNP